MPSPGDRSVSIAILVVGALPALLDDPLSIGRRTGATHLPFCRIGDSTPPSFWLNCLQQGFFARTGLAERRYYRTMSADSATYRGEGSADGCFALRQAPSVRRVLRAWIRLVQSRPVVPILHGHADVGNDHRPHSGIGLQHRVGCFVVLTEAVIVALALLGRLPRLSMPVIAPSLVLAATAVLSYSGALSSVDPVVSLMALAFAQGTATVMLTLLG